MKRKIYGQKVKGREKKTQKERERGKGRGRGTEGREEDRNIIQRGRTSR